MFFPWLFNWRVCLLWFSNGRLTHTPTQVTDLHTYAKFLPFLSHQSRGPLLDVQKTSRKQEAKVKIRDYCTHIHKMLVAEAARGSSSSSVA